VHPPPRTSSVSIHTSVWKGYSPESASGTYIIPSELGGSRSPPVPGLARDARICPEGGIVVNRIEADEVNEGAGHA
jgi:hypothetical protein